MSKAWMPLYVGDYLRDTRHLTVAQHGAYLLLIMHYWERGGLPTDDATLKRIVGLHSVDGENQWRSIRQAIAPFFDENWRHGRIERELEKAKQISLKRAVFGKKGGLLSRGRNNMDRHADQAIAKQRGGQSHKSITTTVFSVAAREESGTTEIEPAAPSEPTKPSSFKASPTLEKIIQAKGWVR